MVDKWMRFEKGGEENSGFSMRGFFPGDSLWFKGHFPEKAILPGVAMLMLAKEAIRAWAVLRDLSLFVFRASVLVQKLIKICALKP